MLKYLSCVLVTVVLVGCESTEGLIKERNALSAELAVQFEKNAALNSENKQLDEKLTFMTGVANNLKVEKDIRVKETASVRQVVREFVRDQMQVTREFSHNANLLDYIGGEVIDRATIDGEDQILVDFKQAFARPALIMGGKVFVRAPCEVYFCVFRPVEDNMVIIWQSSVFQAEQVGVNSFTFNVPVNVEQGDLVALGCKGAVQVPYDLGTGGVRFMKRSDGSVGIPLNMRSFSSHSDMRNYSFGVSGFLD